MTERELYKSISTKLKEIRKDKGMSQEQFSNYLNVSFFNYQRIEAPNTMQTMSIALLLSISNKLNIDIKEML